MDRSIVILGIDPGLANTGWGIIEAGAHHKRCLAYGCISTSADDPIDHRLKRIHDGIVRVIERYGPSELGIESIFFSANAKSAIATGEARGAALVAVASAGLLVGEYTPLQIKDTVVGNGTADKSQVQYMVRAILGLDHDPRPDHASDALGAAICHAHLRKSGALEKMVLDTAGQSRPSDWRNAGERKFGLHDDGAATRESCARDRSAAARKSRSRNESIGVRGPVPRDGSSGLRRKDGRVG